MGKVQEIAERKLVQQSLKKALEWLGEPENDTVRPMFYGGQGIIFRVESKQYPYPLSIKIPLFDDSYGAEKYRSLIRKDWELQSLGAGEDHRIFPELVFCDEAGDFLIRQYLEGEVLYHAIDEASDGEKVQLFLKATTLTAQIFAAFHENRKGGYILRDYRARNILLEEGTGRLYLIDCGSCKKEIREIPETYEKQQDDLGNGKMFSWSPERLMDWREMIDRRADFFSYGVLAYHILYGSFPYSNSRKDEGEAWQAFYREYREAETRIRRDDRLKEMPPELMEQLIGCLHPDPHKRFVGKLVTP